MSQVTGNGIVIGLEALNFHFGIGVWPEGLNRDACDQGL